MKPEQIFQQIKDWHLQRTISELQGYFTIGDMLLNAAIATSLRVTQVVRRVKLMMGELACSDTHYRRAIRFARTYNPNQRQVLLDKCVSVNRIDKLATAYYTDKQRTTIIAHIKHGEIKNWSRITTPRERANLKVTAPLRHGLQHPNDVVVIRIKDNGYFQRDLMFDGLRSLVSQVPQDALVEQLNAAIEACKRSGLPLKKVKLA